MSLLTALYSGRSGLDAAQQGFSATSLNVAKYRQLFGLPKEEALSLRTTCSMRKEQNALKVQNLDV